MANGSVLLHSTINTLIPAKEILAANNTEYSLTDKIDAVHWTFCICESKQG
jgi:hypothetical protein